MRKKLFTLLFAVAASVGTMFAEIVQIGDLYYNLDNSKQIAEVTSQYKSNPYWSTPITMANIPSSVTYNEVEYRVTSIGNHAFYKCTCLTSVTIPNSVTSIGDISFYGCTSLTSIALPNSVTIIGYDAFDGCSSLISPVFNAHMFAYMPTSYSGAYIIPNGIESIVSEAFRGCSSLTSVTIPNSVTSIGNSAFAWCTILTSINVATDNAIYSSEDGVLFDKVKTTLIQYPCGQQGAYIIPQSVTSIGYRAFSGCSGLTSVTIPNSVTSIGDLAFSGCSGLTSITIPNSVTSIGSSTFAYCSSLTSVTIPNSVTSIGERAFDECTGLTSVTIPNSVTSIGDFAFYECENLASIIIPNSVMSIGSGAFSNCPNLPVIDNVRYADTYLVEAVDKTQETYTIKNGTRWIESSAFANCVNLTSIVIPDGITNIPSYAFYACSNLTSVTIPTSVNSIEYYAFRDCNNLNSIKIADIASWCAIQRISWFESPYNLYLNDTLMTNVEIPDGVTEIGSFSFRDCISISSVVIPKSVNSVGTDAFNGCINLQTIYVLPTTPFSINYWSFSNIHDNAVVYVPLGCVDVYKSTPDWNKLNVQCTPINQVITSSSSSISIRFEAANTIISSCGIEGGEQQPGNVLEYIGLEPNSEYNNVPVMLTTNTGETETVNVSFTTSSLELTTKPSKPVSSTTAILLAETNMSDAEVSCGFEYKRNDAPADMSGTKVYCPVASGQMAGRLKNLKDDTYYKYRAFYQSKAGNMYYGDWQYIFTGDVAVEFDPILYTYEATIVRENEATISGYALAGSEDFTEQGFEYWAESRANGGANAPRRMTTTIGEHKFAQASGIKMTVTLTDLDEGTVYKYRAYGKAGEQYFYGTEQTFTTNGTYTPLTYMITFVNWDGTELQASPVEENMLPVYTGHTPVRPEDAGYTYTFDGWTPAIVIATADATYTATYTETPKGQGIDGVQSNHVQCRKVIHNGQILILRGNKTYTTDGRLVR